MKKIITLPPSYCPRILDLVHDVAEQIKHYNGIGDSGKSWILEELKTQQVASGGLRMVAFSVYYWVLGELVFVQIDDRRKGFAVVEDNDFCDGPLRPCLKSWVFSSLSTTYVGSIRFSSLTIGMYCSPSYWYSRLQSPMKCPSSQHPSHRTSSSSRT